MEDSIDLLCQCLMVLKTCLWPAAEWCRSGPISPDMGVIWAGYNKLDHLLSDNHVSDSLIHTVMALPASNHSIQRETETKKKLINLISWKDALWKWEERLVQASRERRGGWICVVRVSEGKAACRGLNFERGRLVWISHIINKYIIELQMWRTDAVGHHREHKKRDRLCVCL